MSRAVGCGLEEFMMKKLLTILFLALPITSHAQEYYDHTTYPATGSAATSAGLRAEFDAVEAGFNKLPGLAGNANKACVVNSTATGLTVTSGTLSLAGNFTTSGANALTLTTTGATNVTLPTTGTLATTSNKLNAFAATTSAELAGVISDESGSGALCFVNSPTLITPNIGVATATSVNKVAITAPASSATLTLANGSTLATSGANSITLTSTGATNVTLPTTGTLATTSANTFTGSQIGGVTSLTSSGGTVAINLANNNNFSHTLTENTTLGAPSNPVAGQSGMIVFTQHASAPKTLGYNAFWKFAGGVVPALTATNGAVDVFVYYVESATRATCSLIKDVK